MNTFIYTNTNKRFHTLAYHNQQLFGKRVWKAVIDGGFSCPNIDGICGTGGCIFCDGGSGYFTNAAAMPIAAQVDAELQRIHSKHPGDSAIAYFQAHTNTYAPLAVLRQRYEAALMHPAICGISIGTRPDCLPDPVIDYLAALATQTTLTVELGLQTVHDSTAERINRGYPYAVFLNSYYKLKAAGIRVCIHLINGLPGESTADMLETARQVGLLQPDAVKLQLLHVIRGTALADWYAHGLVEPMTQEAYVSLVAQQLTLFPPSCVMERITGDGDRRTLLAPLWSVRKRAVLAAIDKELAENDFVQGCNFIS